MFQAEKRGRKNTITSRQGGLAFLPAIKLLIKDGQMKKLFAHLYCGFGNKKNEINGIKKIQCKTFYYHELMKSPRQFSLC